MPTYKIIFEKEAQKFLDKQDRNKRLRLYKAIYKLPEGTDIKKLKGHNLYRLRVGDCRILYTIDDSIRLIDIENIDNRGDIYKNLQIAEPTAEEIEIFKAYIEKFVDEAFDKTVKFTKIPVAQEYRDSLALAE